MADQRQLSLFDALDRLDLMFLLGKHNEAMMLCTRLLPALAALRADTIVSRDFHYGRWQEELAEVSQRFAGHWRQLLASGARLEQINVNELLPHLDTLHAVMAATFEGRLDSFARVLHQKVAGQYRAGDLLRLVLAWSPHSTLEWNLFSHYPQLPQLVAMQAVATLALAHPVSAPAVRAQAAAMALLASGQVDESAIVRFSAPGLLAAAWRTCVAHPEGEKAAALLAGALERTVGLTPGDADVVPSRLHQGKPVMLVLLVADMRLSHRQALEVTLAQAGDYWRIGVRMDAGVALSDWQSCLDQIEDVASAGKPGHLFNSLRDLSGRYAPALLVLPDSPAPVWTLLLARRRLAGYQLVLGLPDSLGWAPELDAALVDQPLHPDGLPALLPPAVPPGNTACEALSWRSGEQFNVAILAWPAPLTPQFLDALRELAAQLGDRWRPVFVTDQDGLSALALEYALMRALPEAAVEVVDSPAALAAILGQCHYLVRWQGRASRPESCWRWGLPGMSVGAADVAGLAGVVGRRVQGAPTGPGEAGA